MSNNLEIYFDATQFEHAQRLAKLVSTSNFIPEKLRGNVADCFLVIQQALRWKMDPFAVAQATFVIGGKLGYEGKLVAAAINCSGRLDKSLDYKYQDDIKKGRGVTVTGILKGEVEPREVTIFLKDVQTSNKVWTSQPDQQLAYRGAREWARRHLPEVILGVYSEDEDFADRSMKDVSSTYTPAAPHAITSIINDVLQEEAPAVDENDPAYYDKIGRKIRLACEGQFKDQGQIEYEIQEFDILPILDSFVDLGLLEEGGEGGRTTYKTVELASHEN